jgi:hypothetical protein
VSQISNIATDAPDINANDYVMSMNMANTLHQHYPGHLWAVTCDGTKGIATVRNLGLSGKWGFVLKLKDHSTASDWDKRIVRAGGELLERYRLTRGKLRIDEYGALNTDFSGNFTADQ